MFARAALGAAGVCLFSLRSLAGAVPTPDAQPRSAAVDRGADSQATVRNLRAMSQSLPDCAAKSMVLPLLQRIDDGAAQLPKDQRDAFVARNIAELTALASGLSPDAVPKEVLKQVQNGAAYLNNRANRWDEAARLSAQVLSLDPRNRDALLNRSNAECGLQDFRRAFQDADQAVQLDSDDPDGYAARALACYGLADYLRTMEDARRALALNPNDRTAYALLRLAEGRVPRIAINDVKSRLEVEVQREYHGMVAQLNQVEARSQQPPRTPTSAAVARLLHDAASSIALKDYHAAVAAADKVLAEDRDNPEAYYYRAAAYNLIGQYGNAVSNADRALTIDPNETAARDARSFAYNHMGRFNDALADANHSLELDARNPYAFANRGFAHEKMGDLESMLADLKNAAELNAQFEPVYHDAAAAYGLDAAPAAAPVAAPPASGGMSRRRQFLVILLSSVAGGLLIALGLLHVLGARWARPAAPASAAGSSSAIEDSYVIGRALGRGGGGAVHEAVDKALGRKVAVKMLLDESRIDARAKARLLGEARMVAALHHPNIVGIHSLVADDKGLYLVFEFIEGRTIAELIARQGRLSLDEARAFLKPVCAALDFAHRRGVVHRDLKPGHIMVTDSGVVKVMDFGVSRRIQDKLQTLTGSRPVGAATDAAADTPYCMAPEQERGAIRPESDIYSLGTCLYEMVTGRRPFPPPASYAQKTAADYPRPSALEPSLPRSFDMLIDGALHPDPDKRIRTAADFWSLLEAARARDAGPPPS